VSILLAWPKYFIRFPSHSIQKCQIVSSVKNSFLLCPSHNHFKKKKLCHFIYFILVSLCVGLCFTVAYQSAVHRLHNFLEKHLQNRTGYFKRWRF
jgi:hypothetical protein